jgi:hypothetical protein
VRKAANITGIICAIAILIGSVMRMIHFPGGGLFIILFTGTFAGFALPMNLIALRREKKEVTGIRKFAFEVGTVAAMQCVIIMLFMAQNWKGADKMLIQTGIFVALFLVLLVLIARKESGSIQLVSKFNVTVVVILLVLIIPAVLAVRKNEGRARLEILNSIETRRCDSLGQVVDKKFHEFQLDSSMTDSAHEVIEGFHINGLELIKHLEKVQLDLANQMNNGLYYAGSDTSLELQNPMDSDFPTFYFVGNVQSPTGKAIELHSLFVNYRDYYLHPAVPFFVQPNSTNEESLQWVKDNFYHAKAIEAMMRLTVLKENVYQSMEYSLDHNLFVDTK